MGPHLGVELIPNRALRLQITPDGLQGPEKIALTSRSPHGGADEIDFGAPIRGPRAAKINQKLRSEAAKKEKLEGIDFLHPSLAKSLF